VCTHLKEPVRLSSPAPVSDRGPRIVASIRPPRFSSPKNPNVPARTWIEAISLAPAALREIGLTNPGRRREPAMFGSEKIVHWHAQFSANAGGGRRRTVRFGAAVLDVDHALASIST
jgi:hypothetical protein